MVFVSPGVPGARPSNSSEASTLTVCEMRSGSMEPAVSAAKTAETPSSAMSDDRLLILDADVMHHLTRDRTHLPTLAECHSTGMRSRYSTRTDCSAHTLPTRE